MTSTRPIGKRPIRVLARNDAWAVELPGRCRTRLFLSRQLATEAAVARASREHCDVIVHDHNGDIERVVTYDPESGPRRVRWWMKVSPRQRPPVEP